MGRSSLQPTLTTPDPEQLSLKADKVLARRASAGQREAFQEIVDTHKQRMFTVARSVIGEAALAEDVVQEAFIKAYRALPEFRGDSRLSTWLYRITYLTAIDLQRQQTRHRQLASELLRNEPDEPDCGQETGAASIQHQQLRKEIDQALNQLSPFEQTVFTLRHMQNFKLREIAIVVDRSEGTVKNILFRAIRKLRDQLLEVAPDFVDPDFVEIKTC